MGGNGSGAKKGQKRRTNAQIDADKRERREAADKRAANVAFWSVYAAGQPAAQPAAAVDVDDNHDDDAAAADGADDGNDAVPNPADPQPDPPLPILPADPPGPPMPLYEVGDSVISRMKGCTNCS